MLHSWRLLRGLCSVPSGSACGILAAILIETDALPWPADQTPLSAAIPIFRSLKKLSCLVPKRDERMRRFPRYSALYECNYAWRGRKQPEGGSWRQEAPVQFLIVKLLKANRNNSIDCCISVRSKRMAAGLALNPLIVVSEQ